MNKLHVGQMTLYRMVTMFLLLLALTGCIAPPPSAGAPAPMPSRAPAATTALTDTLSLPAGGGDEMAERVDFPPGTATVTLSDTLVADSDQDYALAASTGQTVTVETEGNAEPVNFTVYGPGGATWSGEAQADAGNRMTAQFTAPESGDYLVTLTTPADGAETEYKVMFTIDPSAVARIEFPAGDTMAEQSGSLPAGEASQQFLLSGNVGWTMTVDATSDEAPLSMTIEDPSGMQWIPEMRPTDNGYTIGQQFTLPEPGYYLVTVRKGEQTPSINYTITFTLNYGS